MWYCAFCNVRNEHTADHCTECGAHRPVDVTLEEARNIAPNIPVRIAGIRFWVFIPALILIGLATQSYRTYLADTRVVAGYRSDCANLSNTTTSSACTGIPAIYHFQDATKPTSPGIIEITPIHQTPFDLTADPSGFPMSGQGLAIFWHGKLTAMYTIYGQIETNLSPINAVHDQQAPIFCWFLMAMGAAFLPFMRGWALIIEPDVDEDLKPKNK